MKTIQFLILALLCSNTAFAAGETNSTFSVGEFFSKFKTASFSKSEFETAKEHATRLAALLPTNNPATLVLSQELFQQSYSAESGDFTFFAAKSPLPSPFLRMARADINFECGIGKRIPFIAFKNTPEIPGIMTRDSRHREISVTFKMLASEAKELKERNWCWLSLEMADMEIVYDPSAIADHYIRANLVGVRAIDGRTRTVLAEWKNKKRRPCRGAERCSVFR